MSDGIHNNKRLLERGASLPSTPPSASEPTDVAKLSNDRIYNAAIDAAEDDPVVKEPDQMPYRVGFRRGARFARDFYESQASELVRLRGLETKLRELWIDLPSLPDDFSPNHSEDAFYEGRDAVADRLRAILSEETHEQPR